MAQLMPLPLTVSCSSKIQIGFTFLVPAHPGSPGKEAVKWLFNGCIAMWHKNGSLVEKLEQTFGTLAKMWCCSITAVDMNDCMKRYIHCIRVEVTPKF